MAIVTLNGDRILSITGDASLGIDVGPLPAGASIDVLRYDGTSMVNVSDTTAYTEFYVEQSAEEGFILHLLDSTAYVTQLVQCTWDDRYILTNDNGTIRVKTPAELQYEADNLEFDSGIVQAENVIEQQIRYDRKLPTDIVITDKSLRNPDNLKVLYNGDNDDYITIDTTSDLVITDSTSELNYWIQYRFPVERMIKKVFVYGDFDTTGSNVIAAFFGQSLNGTDWTYLGYDSTSESLVQMSYENAQANYYGYTDERMDIDGGIGLSVLKGTAAKYFRIFFLEPETDINDHNFELSELRFNEIVKAQDIEVETLSAFSADVGLVTAGVVQSSNFDDGGVRLDLDNDVLKVYDAAGTLRVELGKLS